MNNVKVAINLENSKVITGVIEGRPTIQDVYEVLKQVFPKEYNEQK